MNPYHLTDILEGLVHQGALPDRDQIKYLLDLSTAKDLNRLFKAARQVRNKFFGNKIFLYGFLYFSTHCRNSCNFCQYRQTNDKIPRYRKTEGQILRAAREMADAGVHLIDLTMGEDPELYASGNAGFKGLVEIVQKVREATGLPVMISPGAIPDAILEDLSRADTAWFACYQETHNRILYQTLRKNQDFDSRLNKKKQAKNLGMLIEEGILTGVGESLDDLAESILWMKDFSVDQARVMTFVPQKDTPMAHLQFQDTIKEQIIIAVMRLVLGDVLIPATLDVDGLDGLTARLDAGANVVTSIVPPENGLAGVANLSLDIEESRRTLDQILPVMKRCNLVPATQKEYIAWISNRKTGRD